MHIMIVLHLFLLAFLHLVTLVEIGYQTEDGLYLCLALQFQGLVDIAFDWLELSKFEDKFGQVYICGVLPLSSSMN